MSRLPSSFFPPRLPSSFYPPLLLSLLSLLSLCLATACSNSDENGPATTQDGSSAGDGGARADGGAGGDAGPDAAATPDAARLALTWTDCPGGNGAWPDAECASLERPFTSDSDKEITIWLKRRPATGTRRGQLWLLEGGPGPAAGDYLEPQMADLIARVPDLDVYTLDHRGAGYATLLDCPTYAGDYTKNAKACVDEAQKTWGANLVGFSTTEAARDLGALIAGTREPGDAVLIYARSYGTYVVNRYLQLHPSQPTGVILDSLCAPDHCIDFSYDDDFNAISKTFFDLCGQDPTCKEKLGADPWATLGEHLKVMDAGGHCPSMANAGLDGVGQRMQLASMIKVRAMWPMIAPLIYRLKRCSDDDITAIVHFFQKYAPGALPPRTSNPQRAASWLLERHIMFSESTLESVPSYQELVDGFMKRYVSVGYTLNFTMYPGWPRYPRDPATTQWAKTSVPLLVLQGTLDTATPHQYAEPAKQKFSAPNQHFVSLPRTPHSVLQQTPLADGAHCGAKIALQFIENPTGSLDDSCAEAIIPIDFSAASFDPQTVFGTASAWE